MRFGAGAWVLCGALGCGVGWGQAPGRIPAVHGTTLAGEEVTLPESLKGKTCVLVIGFSRDSREAVAAWGRRLAGDYGGSPGVAYYEMAMLGGVPKMLRGWVLGKIRDSVPDRAKAHFLPVTESEVPWREVAGYGKADDPYVLVVDSNGQVIWEKQGAATDAAYAEVKAKVEGQEGKASSFAR